MSMAGFSLDRRIVLGEASDGSPILSLLSKASFKIIPNEILRQEADMPLALTDSDADVESELVAWKPLSDLILVGKAHAPRGKKARFMDASITVDGRAVPVRVFGDRLVDLSKGSIRITDPEPFDSMPLGCEFAYGGVDSLSDPGSTYIYPPNPFGKGYRVFKNPETLQGLMLPNLEDPERVLSLDSLFSGASDRWDRQPMPRFFGCLPRSSYPRIELAGLPPSAALDAQLAHQKTLASSSSVGAKGEPPVPPPKLMDPRFYNCAPELLQFPHLEGTETIRLSYMDPDLPEYEFELPGVCPEGWIDVGEGREFMDMTLQTVEVRAEERVVHLVWRGSCAWAGPGSDAQDRFTRFEHGVNLG